MRILALLSYGGLVGALALASATGAGEVEEFKVKRQEVFEFEQKPRVSRRGDRVEIAFAAKSFCDVTVALENPDGKIVRHLACGVLGSNAPEPLQKGTLQQTVVWDGKDDRGKYLDDKESYAVRVSLGLKPLFERNLFWSPYKRISSIAPLIQAAPEGVLVYEGYGSDTLKLYGRDGRYLRTVYPFPAGQLAKVQGLDWFDFPQGLRLPLKKGLYQHTLLTSGENSEIDGEARNGNAASALGVRDARIVLAKNRLNRMALDGSTGGALLNGPESGPHPQTSEHRNTWRQVPGGPKTGVGLKGIYTMTGGWNQALEITPTSAAISPDGKWLYLAGYAWRHPYNFDTLHAVTRMPLDGAQDAKLFAGKIAVSKEGFLTGEGSAPGEFKNAASVDCDAQGRVYVADFMNDRVQVFSPEGKHLKDIAAEKPAQVRVHRRTGEIYVFTFPIPSRLLLGAKTPLQFQPALARLGAYDDPKPLAHYDLPLPKWGGKYGTYTGLASALTNFGEVDSWAEPLTVWLGRECRNDIESGVAPGNGGQTNSYETAGIRVLREKNGKLEEILDFGKETVKEALRAKPPTNVIQRLEVNPVTGKLYVGEADSGPTIKNQKQLLEIDPESGRIKIHELPFNAMEFTFDLDGCLYLRATNAIARYEFPSLREVPWDYGEEMKDLGSDAPIAARITAVISALPLPAKPPVCFHQSGFSVSPKGHVIAACSYRFAGISGRNENLTSEALAGLNRGKSYMPALFPGRESSSTSACLHIWDKHGKMLYDDALPGMSQADGVHLDRDGNIYLMHTPVRMLNGTKYFNEMSETLMKIKPKAARVFGDAQSVPVPLTAEMRPARPPELYKAGTRIWSEGAEWYYGGVGYAGFNTPFAGGGCACRFARFALDLFARSIVPEPYQFNVGVLDANGNLILHLGRYGNVDSAGAQSPAPLGGDEVGLFHPCYVATHTDRRIFISDTGNGRIVSVKLEYHASERIPLKGVPDVGK